MRTSSQSPRYVRSAAMFSFANVSPYSTCRSARHPQPETTSIGLNSTPDKMRVVPSIVSPVAGRIGYALA